MKTAMLDGEMRINSFIKVIKIEDLNGSWCVYSGSLFTIDTTSIDWFTSKTINQYKSYEVYTKITFPYLVRNPKMWTYK